MPRAKRTIKNIQGYLTKEYAALPSGAKQVIFSWSKLSEDCYLITLPQVFRKEPGDAFKLATVRQFLSLKKEQALWNK